MSRSILVLAAVVAALFGCGATESDTLPPVTPGTSADTSAPSTPVNISASAASASSITVSWDAAVDDTGVSAYRVLRCTGGSCTPNNQVAQATSTSFADTGLNAGTSYSYRVAAVDAAGNASPASSRVTATTLANTTPPTTDTQAPTAPANLTASATSATAVALSWTAATDNVGVAGYRVYRCSGSGCTPTAQVATPTATSFNDSGLVAATSYGYRVAAIDAAGNLSPASATAAVTTQAAPVSSGGVDFATRCAAAGVVLCQGFDDASKFGAAVYPGTGLYPASDGRILGSQDTTVKTSGAGSLKLTGLAGGANTAGQWVQDIGTTFGQNTTFYVQYRYRLTREMINGTGGGRKLSIFHYAFNSCADLEITTQNTFYRGIPQMYTDCGSQATERTSGGTIYLQQGGDPFPTGEGWNCPYGGINGTRCAMFQADQWMTLYYRIDIGTWGTANSRIQAWVAYDGQPLKQFINMPNYRINNSGPTFPGIDHITLTPYDTGASSAPNGSVWYDDLIVSRQPIAPPTGVSSGTSPQ